MPKKTVEAIFPLSPMQQALLFQSLQSQTIDPGFLTVRCTLEGRLDRTRFETAWQEVVGRHPVLRSSIHWQDLDKPLQVVYQKADLAWDREDWGELVPKAQNTELSKYLRQNQCRGLTLSQAPVMRLALLQLSAECHHFIWSCHHVLLDGWSAALVLEEVFARYEAASGERSLPQHAPRPYREYVTWLQNRDMSQAEGYWRQRLRGYREPMPLGSDPLETQRTAQGESQDRQSFTFSKDFTTALQEMVQAHQVTLNAVLQGTWAMLLSRYMARHDVLFGVSVSGRSIGFPGIESMVGLFANVLPLRLRVDGSASLVSWLRELMDVQSAMSRFEYAAPMQIQEWSEVPGRMRLFDSLLVVENYPWQERPDDQADTLRVRDFHGDVTTNARLTVVVKPGAKLEIQFYYDARCFTAAAIAEMLKHFQRLLEKMVDAPTQALQGALDAIMPRPLAVEVSTQKRTSSGDNMVAPRTPVECELVDHWRQLFGLERVGIRDNFFDLGGQSLLAVRLVEKIRRTYRLDLSLAMFFEAPTIEQIARIVQEELGDSATRPQDLKQQKGFHPKAWTTLVPIQQEGERPPFFCVAGHGGNPMNLRQLSLHLGKDQPFYGLQHRGVDGSHRPHESIQSMAAEYIQDVICLQPKGPYFLGGYSGGGTAAFEMAQQLLEQGERVAALVFLDTPSPTVPRRSKLGRMRLHLQRLEREGLSYGWKVMKRYRKRPLRKLKQLVLNPLVKTFPARFREDSVVYYWASAIGAYQPKPYPGRAILFRVEMDLVQEGTQFVFSEFMGWEDLIEGGIEVVYTPGTHLNLVNEPHVETLAKKLKQALCSAQDAPAGVPS